MRIGQCRQLLRLQNRARLIFCLLVAFSAHVASSMRATAEVHAGQQVPADRKLHVLQMLASQMRGNYEQIHTWKGAYQFTDCFRFEGAIPTAISAPSQGDSKSDQDVSRPTVRPTSPYPLSTEKIPKGVTEGGGYWEVQRGLADFSLDKAAESYHVLYQSLEPIEFIDVASGTSTRWPQPGSSVHWTFTPAFSLEFDVAHKEGQLSGYPPVESVPATGGRIIYKKTVREGKMVTRVIDVRDFFSNGGFKTWERLEMWAKSLKGEGTQDQKRQIEDGLTIFERSVPNPVFTIVATYYSDGGRVEATYDGAVGFNPVRWVHFDAQGAINDEWTVSYGETSGVFIPKSIAITHCRQLGGIVRPTFIRSFEMRDAELNESVSEKEFSVAQFGVAYGERMLDKLDNRLLVYDDRVGFVPAEEFKADFARIPSDGNGLERPTSELGGNSALRTMLLVGNAAIVVVIVCFLLYRRFRSHQRV